MPGRGRIYLALLLIALSALIAFGWVAWRQGQTLHQAWLETLRREAPSALVRQARHQGQALLAGQGALLAPLLASPEGGEAIETYLAMLRAQPGVIHAEVLRAEERPPIPLDTTRAQPGIRLVQEIREEERYLGRLEIHLADPGLPADFPRPRAFPSEVRPIGFMALALAMMLLALTLFVARDLCLRLLSPLRALRQYAAAMIRQRHALPPPELASSPARTLADTLAELGRHAFAPTPRPATEEDPDKKRFLATLGHELRTPLNGIIGMTELLLKSDLPRQPREFAEVAWRSAREQLHALDHILAYSELERAARPKEESFSLLQTVEDVAELIAREAARKGVEWVLDLVPDPPRVRGDETRLRQLLTHLVDHALESTPSGTMTLRVSPNGPAREQRQQWVFRLYLPRRVQFQTGLSLTLAKRMAESLQGHLVVNDGGGPQVRLNLPLGVVPGPRETSTPSLAGRAALVIATNPALRQALCKPLTHWGLAVTEAENLADAEETLTPQPEILLVDHSLAKAEWLSAIKQDAHPRVIALVPLDRELSPALSTVVDATLPKPVRQERLREAIVPLAARPLASGPLRVLVAEDNYVNQRVAVHMLKQLGMRVDLAAHGGEAVAKARQNAYDVILMDCQMPEMDGFEATSAIRGETSEIRQVPIIALTANAMPGDREHCLNAGMDDYLRKPFTQEQLREKILAWHRQERASKLGGCPST